MVFLDVHTREKQCLSLMYANVSNNTPCYMHVSLYVVWMSPPLRGLEREVTCHIVRSPKVHDILVKTLNRPNHTSIHFYSITVWFWAEENRIFFVDNSNFTKMPYVRSPGLPHEVLILFIHRSIEYNVWNNFGEVLLRPLGANTLITQG